MKRNSQPHFVEGMKYPLPADALRDPPVPCEFAVGDLVTFKNEFGAVFKNRTVVGFSPTVDYGRFVYYDSSSWWFPVDPKQLTKQAQLEVDREEDSDSDAETDSPLVERPVG